jgi:hypothetical protein
MVEIDLRDSARKFTANSGEKVTRGEIANTTSMTSPTDISASKANPA